MNDLPSCSSCLDLEMIINVVSSLQRVVADFYGPQCSQTLLTSQTGKAVVTSDGLSIVEALQAAHPISQLVFKSLKSCHSVTLDGCKTFLIYLANFLVHLREEIYLGRFCHAGMNVAANKKAVDKQGIILAKKYVRQLKHDVLPNICGVLQQHSCELSRRMIEKMGRDAVIKCLFFTTLMPHYSPTLCNHFSQVLITSLATENKSQTFRETTNFLVDNYFDINIKVPDRPYGDNTHIEPLLLDRDFTVKHKNLFSLCRPSVLIFKGSIVDSGTDEDSQKTLLVKQSGQIVNLVQARRKMIQQFVHNCHCKNIDLLICTQGVPGYSLDIFKHKNISVIANVSEKDAELLEILTGKLSINSINDVLSEINIIHLNEIRDLIIGGKQYVQVKLDKMTYQMQHLIICAPTVGLCDQLAINIHKALNALKMCLNSGNFEGKISYVRNSACLKDSKREEVHNSPTDSVVENLNGASDLNVKRDLNFDSSTADISANEKLNIIEGGGAFEILFNKLLQDFAVLCSDPNLSLICEILGKTMISLVKTLYDNTSIQSESSRAFLEVKSLLQEKVNGENLWGLNRRGLPVCVADQGIVEPLVLKMHALNCVLDLVDQLLGIDQIVSVNKLEVTVDDE